MINKLKRKLNEYYCNRIKFRFYEDKYGNHIVGNISFKNDFGYTFDYIIHKDDTVNKVLERINKAILESFRKYE